MIYKDFKGLKLSQLGFGAMRLPVIDGDDSRIDEEAALELVSYAHEHGINYFDTAWYYHGKNSEAFMGKALRQFSRDSYYLATKFPGYNSKNMTKAKEIFEKQLEICQVEYFDFYLLHNVSDSCVDSYLDENNGVLEYFVEQRNKGRIKHLGFSNHGSLACLKKFLDTAGSYMEFGQLQLNYLDWSFQHGEELVELLDAHKLPVWVMEPVRGGRLATLSEEDSARLKRLRPEEGIPAWAFRFLQGIPSVTITLSGMSNLEQLKQNIQTYEESRPPSAQEQAALFVIAQGMIDKIAVPCTECRYCLNQCPEGLNIPYLIELYNEHCFTAAGGVEAFIAPMALAALPKDKRPSACTSCGNCEAACPQAIKISEVLQDFVEKLRH